MSSLALSPTEHPSDKRPQHLISSQGEEEELIFPATDAGLVDDRVNVLAVASRHLATSPADAAETPMEGLQELLQHRASEVKVQATTRIKPMACEAQLPDLCWV